MSYSFKIENVYNAPFFILINQQKTKGAVQALDHKTMDRITAKFGEVYVIPSSVDETLIVPKRVVHDRGSCPLSVEEVFGRPASLVGLKHLYGYVYYVIDLCKLFLIGISFFVIV